MTFEEYQKDALRTAPIDIQDDEILGVLHGVSGLCGESGECIDLVKKWAFHGHDLDESRLASELGDVLWYLTVSAAAIGMSLENIAEANVAKRMHRYPNGFETERSINREPNDI